MSSCAYCRKPSEGLRCSRCKAINYCSRDCQKSHWGKHKVECQSSVSSPPVSIHLSDDPAATALALVQKPSLSEAELQALGCDPGLPQWGWDLLDPLVNRLQDAHLQPAVLRLLRRICEVCTPSEVFLSLMCHLTSPDTYNGIDFKLELLYMITSLLPRVKSTRRLSDFVDQLYPAFVTHLSNRQEGNSRDEYEAFYQAIVRFVDTLSTLSPDVRDRVAQCQILLLQHRFELDRQHAVQAASPILPSSGLRNCLPSVQAERLLEQKASNWAQEGLALYLSFFPPSNLYAVELLYSSNPLVFARGVAYTQALLSALEPSEAALWPLVDLLLTIVCKLEDRDLRRQSVGLLQSLLDRPREGEVSLTLLQRAISACQTPSVTALLLHQYKERMRTDLDCLDSGNSMNEQTCFASEPAARWIFSCLRFEENLDQLVARCDVFCAALNCYRFVLLRDRKDITKLQHGRQSDYRHSIEPLLVAVTKAQHALQTMPESGLAHLRFPGSVGLARLQMVEDLGRRITEIVQLTT